MKANLVFNLDEHSDVEAFNRANKAMDMALVLYDILELLRVTNKYGQEGVVINTETLDFLRKEINLCLERRDVVLENLIS